MNREEFIASIIAAIEQQNAEPAITVGKIDGTRCIAESLQLYRKLCFDFPLLSLENSNANSLTFPEILKCFNSELLKIVSSSLTSSKELRSIFNLNAVFLNNLTVFIPSLLHSKAKIVTMANDKEIWASLYLICNTIFFKFPLALLTSSDQVSLSKLFSARTGCIYGLDDVDTEVSVLDWNSICISFQEFVLRSSASNLIFESQIISRECGAGPSELEGMQAAISAISSLTRILSMSANKQDPVRTLESFLLQNVRDPASPYWLSSIETVKTCWLHLTLLLRDMFLRRPDLLKLTIPNKIDASLTRSGTGAPSSAASVLLLSYLGDALRPSDVAGNFGSPFVGENLFIFVIASLCSGLCQQQRTNEGSGDMDSNESERRQALAEGRSAMLQYLRSQRGAPLTWLVDCCARTLHPPPSMASQPKSASHSSLSALLEFPMEPADHLLDLSALLLAPEAAVSSLEGTFLSSRLLPTLLKMLLGMVDRDVSVWASLRTSTSHSVLPSVSPALANCAHRLVKVLGRAFYRCEAMAVFAIGYPDLMRGLHSLLIPSSPGTAEEHSFSVTGGRSLTNLLLLPSSLLLVLSVCLICGSNNKSSEEERSQLLRIVQAASNSISKDLGLLLLLDGLSSGGEDRTELTGQTDRQRGVAPQVNRISEAFELVAQTDCIRQLSAGNPLERILKDLCSSTMANLTEYSIRMSPSNSSTVEDNPLPEEREASEPTSSEELKEKAVSRREVLETIDAAVSNLRKSMKMMLSMLDTNISSNKID